MNKPITLCDRCKIAASCLLNYDETLCRKNRTVEPTNADRLRAMTDEELATWIDRIQADAYERGMMETPIVDYPNIYSEWLEWLKQEVGNERT